MIKNLGKSESMTVEIHNPELIRIGARNSLSCITMLSFALSGFDEDAYHGKIHFFLPDIFL